MQARDREPAATRVKDGAAWRLGTDAELSWIATQTTVSLSIASAIPLVFEGYATVVLPECPGGEREARSRAISAHDRAILGLLERHTAVQPWWLGYLDTGGADIVFEDAPKAALSGDSRYVLVEAGPRQAGSWRTDDDWKGTMLPDLIFPRDRSWLLSTLWDDDWTCIGGSRALIDDLLADELLAQRARRVTADQEDATPPGHVAI